MRVSGWILVGMVGTLGTAAAQERDVPSREPMRKLAFLEGEWEGEATINDPGGVKRLRQTESVRYSNSGHALIIQGTGWEKDAGGAEHLVYNAVAVMTWDQRGGYRMRSFLMEGRTGEFAVEPSDSGFTWGFDIPEGKIRYTMTLTPAGEWHEVGEFSRANGPAMRTMEFTVRKKR
jgi:hypothetical protein